ncbi:MAG: Ig-like domain-containing protein [Micromonosporaceae bacterium]
MTSLQTRLRTRRAIGGLAALVLAFPLVAAVLGSAAVADVNEASAASLVDKQRRISVGNLHSCAITDAGEVECWGGNDNGQLGNGTTTTSTAPVPVSGVSAALQLAAGGSHTCVLVHGGTVRCWGLNGNGQLGMGTTDDAQLPTAQTVVGISGAVAVAAGGFHSCAILGDGTVKCWGSDGMGQLGDGNPGDTSATPVVVSGLTGAVALALGEFHSCALRTGGTVSCWGHNGFGQLGDGTKVDKAAPTAVAGLPDPAVDPVLVLSTGSSHSCVLLDDDDRTVRCWGHNAYGSLGHATAVVDSVMQPSTSPLTVRFDNNPDPLITNLVPLTGITSLTSGQYHSCARITGGGVRCWGNNNRGQLGQDPKPSTHILEDSVNALPISGLGAVDAVTGGGFHTCTLAGTALKCWGYNFYGQLGGYAPSNPKPVVVTALSGATMVTAGTDFACALINGAITDQPVCWGSNTDGRLGAGLGIAETTVRVPVAGFGGADAIDAGNGHACALPENSNAPKCWGLGVNGQLGNGATSSQSSPVAVSGLTTAGTLSAGGALGSDERGMTCAVRTDEKVSCWGRNANAQLGDGTITDRSAPVLVQIDTDPDPDVVALADLTGAKEVVTGGFHGCARMADTSVRCWGFNGSGQLGDDTTTQRRTAVRVQTDTDPDVDVPLTGVLALAAGDSHTCARVTADAVKCWGFNGSGQLGDGTTTMRKRPTAVPALDGSVNSKKAKLITAGDFHSCATRTDGAMVCWGSDSNGQLGNGSPLSNSATPVVAIPAPEESEAIPLVTSISASRRNTCARMLDTSVSCWGDNSRGQLGDGIGTLSLAPVDVESLPSVGANHIPNPVADTATTTPGTSVNVSPLANDTDADADTLTLTGVSNPPHGTAVDNGDGTVTYTPDAGYCGDDAFTYTVSDGTAIVPGTVTIDMNCAPVAVNDNAATSEDTAVEVNVLSNDTDPDGDTLTITAVTDPARGTATHTATAVTYTPDPDVCGAPSDTMTYTIDDGHGHTANAVVTVAIECGNDGPVAVDDAVATPEGDALVVSVLGNDSDVDGDSLSVSSVAAPSHGTTSTNGSTVTYTPTDNYCGPDSFDYVASDGTLTDTGTVTVAVTCVADSPNALNDVATVAEDGTTTVNVLGNDTDPDGDTLSVSSVTDPAHGTATVNGFGTVDYAPDANYCGPDSFDYVASDGTLTDTASVEVSVSCVNDAPVASDDAASTPEDTLVHVHVATNDTDVDADQLTVVSATDPAHGTTAVDGDSVSYTPNLNFCGSDSFEYTVRDPSGATDTGAVSVTVSCVNDPPAIGAVADKTTAWGDPVAETLSVSDVDAGDSHTFTLVSGPVGAAVTTGGEFSWTPTASQVGSHTVTVKVTDSGGASSQTGFTVTVTKRAVTVVYGGASTGQYSDPATVSAMVTDTATGDPVSGVTVGFTIGGLTASATSGPTGEAATSMLLLGPTGDTTAKSTFAGSAAYTAAADSDPFSISKETVTARFTGQHLTLAAAAPVQLTASVTEQADTYLGTTLATTKVTFTQVGGGILCTAMVSVSSPGTGTATCATASLPAGSRAVVVSVSGPSYAGPVDVTGFTVAAPATGDAAGSGQVGDADDFGFAVTAPKKGGPTGDAAHVFVSGNTAYVVRSASITSLTRSCTGGSQKVCTVTVIAGNASTVAVDLTTGAVSAVAGTSTIRIDATDPGAPSDTYAVAVTGGTTYTLGAPGAQQPLSYGDVRVPS